MIIVWANARPADARPTESVRVPALHDSRRDHHLPDDGTGADIYVSDAGTIRRGPKDVAVTPSRGRPTPQR